MGCAQSTGRQICLRQDDSNKLGRQICLRQDVSNKLVADLSPEQQTRLTGNQLYRDLRRVFLLNGREEDLTNLAKLVAIAKIAPEVWLWPTVHADPRPVKDALQKAREHEEEELQALPTPPL